MRAIIPFEKDNKGSIFFVSQACRNGLVQHLENLLFYGADMNAKNASGNTPLHVCAVDNQEACARLLLFRGADREALNYANQTPYQVAVIAGNLELASLIHRFRCEDVGESHCNKITSDTRKKPLYLKMLLLFTTSCIQRNSIVQSPPTKVGSFAVHEALDVVQCHDAGRVFHRIVINDRL